MNNVYNFFKTKGNILTLCAARFSTQKGVVDVDDDCVITSFREKSNEDLSYVNSGYMVSSKNILDFIDDDDSALDSDVFPKLSKLGEVNCYKYDGMWRMIEKANDVKELNELWDRGKAFWKNWD